MPSSIISEKLLLSAQEASKALSISARSLWARTAPRGSIPSIRLGSRVLYSTSALQKWIDAETGAAGQKGGGDE